MDEACLLLAEYNGRLAAELEDRRQLARMLTEYINSQKEALNEREKKLEVQHPVLLQFISQAYINSLNKVSYSNLNGNMANIKMPTRDALYQHLIAF